MYTLRKRFTFEAAHRLPKHDGKCARLHGHSWGLVVEVRGPEVQASGPKAGMLLDFGEIKAAVQPLLDGVLDHYYLNETTGLEDPTSEQLAAWVYLRLQGKVPGLYAVEVEETCTCAARFEAPAGVSGKVVAP